MVVYDKQTHRMTGVGHNFAPKDGVKRLTFAAGAHCVAVTEFEAIFHEKS